MQMENAWTQARIQQYIDDDIEESLGLDYKAADALQKIPARKREISKDVSAMANSEGGLIIYGVAEDPNEKHRPGFIDPIDRREISKEWLEQVINSNIKPIIQNVIIHPVDIDTDPNHVVYVVEIPQSNTIHQAKSLKYYMRYNFESTGMDDYMIRAMMNRGHTPRVEVAFVGIDTGGETYQLGIQISNVGDMIVQHLKLKFSFPYLSGLSVNQHKLGSVRIDGTNRANLLGQLKVERLPDQDPPIYEITYWYGQVLFPKETINVGSEIDLKYRVSFTDAQALDPEQTNIHWQLFADTMPFRQGIIPLLDIVSEES